MSRWFRETGKIYAPVRLRSSDNLAFQRQIIRIFRATKLPEKIVSLDRFGGNEFLETIKIMI